MYILKSMKNKRKITAILVLLLCSLIFISIYQKHAKNNNNNKLTKQNTKQNYEKKINCKMLENKKESFLQKKTKKNLLTEIEKNELIINNYKSKNFEYSIIIANDSIQNFRNNNQSINSIFINSLAHSYISTRNFKKAILCLERNFLGNNLFKISSKLNCALIKNKINLKNKASKLKSN